MRLTNNFLFNLVSIMLAMVLSLFFTAAAGGGLFMAGTIAMVLIGIYLTSAQFMPRGALFFALAAKAISKNANPTNIGGLGTTHYWCFKEDILTWPTAMNPDVAAATAFDKLLTIPDMDVFVFKAGKCFFPIPCILEEGQLKSTRVGPTGSNAYEIVASLSEQGNNNELAGAVAYSANKEIVFLAKEQNGSLKVIGTPEAGAQFDTHEITNGGKTSDGNIQKYTVKGYRAYPAPTLLSAVPLTPAVA